jgi:hypothetical protein
VGVYAGEPYKAAGFSALDGEANPGYRKVVETFLENLEKSELHL